MRAGARALSPGAALAACRFAHDAATMLVWGAFATLAALVPRDLADRVASRLRAFRVAATVLAVATVVAVVPLEAAAVGDGWTDALDAAVLRAVLLDTDVGHALLARAAAAIPLALSLVLPARLQPGATAASSGLLLATLALTGHAAMHEGWLGAAHRLNDAAHVLAAGAWLGSLVPLLLVMRALDDPSRRREAGVALARYSAAGHGAVALVLATGTLNTVLVLGRWPVDWTSPYQALLTAKIALVLAMVLLAVVNRYRLVPRMANDRDRALRALRASTMTEVGLGLAAIACVSVFGLLEPA